MAATYVTNRFRIDVFGNEPANEVILYCHGGYTPTRGLLRPGSGSTTVPMGMTIRFYAEPGVVTVGSDGKWVLVGYEPKNPVTEEVSGVTVITNYSLTREEGGSEMHHLFPPDRRPVMDLIRVDGDKKTHLDDLWKALATHQLSYSVLHFYACRVNKLTYKGEIEHA